MYFAVFQVLALAALAAVSAGEDAKDCNALEMVRCALLIDRSKIPDDKWAETDEDLDKRCEGSMPAMKCFHDFAKRCPHLSEMEHLGPFFEAQYHLMEKLCDKNDELRKRFLENAKCINSHRPHMEEECGTFPQIGEQGLNKELCDKYKELFKCHYKELEEHCETKGIDIVKELLAPYEEVLKKMCDKAVFSETPVLRYIGKAVKLF